MQNDHETRLLSFLQNPESYPDPVDEVVIKQTHISIVAIVPPYVYKFKKNVNFGFLDYSTLEKRKKFCEEEVRVNRRLSSGVYLGVVPLYEEEGHLGFEKGQVYDYAVKMKYLPEESNLLDLVLQKKAGEDHISALALCMENFYAGADSSGLSDQEYLKEITESVLDNFVSLQKYVPGVFDAFSISFLESYSRNFLKERSDDLVNRSLRGFVKDCHGDLRAEHIYFQDPARPRQEEVFVVDAIEFNREFREIDVLNDLAFLLMDLDFNNAATLGIRLFFEVTSHMGDHPPAGLVTFYKIYRALVRAKVLAMRAAEEEVPQDERRESAERAAVFVQLAVRYLVCGDLPLAIIVMGKTGSGKSAVARRLAKLTGLTHISSDVVRKEYLGIDPSLPIPPGRKREVYSPEAKREIYETLINKTRESLTNSFGAIVDATFSSGGDRSRLRGSLDAAGRKYLFIELFCDDSVARERLQRRRPYSSHGSDARISDKEMLDSLYETPLEIPEEQLVRIDSSSSLEESINRLFQTVLELKE